MFALRSPVTALSVITLSGILAACGSGGGSSPTSVANPGIPGAGVQLANSLTGSESEAQLLARGLIEKSHAIADIKEAALEQASAETTTPEATTDQSSIEEKRRSVGSRGRAPTSRLSGGGFGRPSFGSPTVISNPVRVFVPPVITAAPLFLPPVGAFGGPFLPPLAVGAPVFGVSPAFWSFNVGFGRPFIPGSRLAGTVNYTFVQPQGTVVPSPGLPTEPVAFAFNGVDIVVADGDTSITGGTVGVNGGLLPGFQLGFDRWRLAGEALVAGSSATLTNALGQQVTILVVSADTTTAVLRVTYGANSPVPGTTRIVNATRQPDGRIAYAVA